MNKRSSKKLQSVVELSSKSQQMKCWDDGWKAYWVKKSQSDCPSELDSDSRDEWMLGWLSAKRADEKNI